MNLIRYFGSIFFTSILCGCFDTTPLHSLKMEKANANRFIEGETGLLCRYLFKTLQAFGLKCRILPTPGKSTYRNCIMVASKEELAFEKRRFPLSANNATLGIHSFWYNTENLDMDDAVIFSDDKPNLEHYNVRAARIWRYEYNQKFTKMFTARGIELFK